MAMIGGSAMEKATEGSELVEMARIVRLLCEVEGAPRYERHVPSAEDTAMRGMKWRRRKPASGPGRNAVR
jgi:hypothetical protein